MKVRFENDIHNTSSTILIDEDSLNVTLKQKEKITDELCKDKDCKCRRDVKLCVSRVFSVSDKQPLKIVQSAQESESWRNTIHWSLEWV